MHKHTPSSLSPSSLFQKNIIAYSISIVSVVSFDLLPEVSDASPLPSARRSNYNRKLGKVRPLLLSLQDAGIGKKRDLSRKPADELKTNRRRKVVCEKAYVDGLDLVLLFSEFLPSFSTFLSPRSSDQNCSELLRTAQNLIRTTQNHSELIRTTQNYSEPLLF